MIAVTTVPNNTPLIGVLVSLYKIFSNLLPATFLRPSPIRDMPYRNSATPHNILSTIETTVIQSPNLILSSPALTPALLLSFTHTHT